VEQAPEQGNNIFVVARFFCHPYHVVRQPSFTRRKTYML
jgi:hypothetical protein